MNNTEYYDRLGVDKNASQDDIKKAYRKLSKKYHPDLNQEPGAEEKYKEVQEAFERLGDPQKRAQYDQFGQPAPMVVLVAKALVVTNKVASVTSLIWVIFSVKCLAAALIRTDHARDKIYNTGCA